MNLGGELFVTVETFRVGNNMGELKSGLSADVALQFQGSRAMVWGLSGEDCLGYLPKPTFVTVL